MPKLEDIKTVCYGKRSQSRYVWHPCESCGTPRWVQVMKGGIARNLRCNSCSNRYKATHWEIHDDVPRNKQGNRLILRVCADCSKQSWVKRAAGGNKPLSPRCNSCAMQKQRLAYWARGEAKEEITSGDRVFVRLDKGSPYYAMVPQNGYIPRSRLVMAESLGRCLASKEFVHHINGNTLDDDISNLELTANGKHASYHRRKEAQIGHK